jgi:hypothetical protein
MKRIILPLIASLLVGCGTTGTIYEFDKEGNITKKTEFSSGAVAEIMNEMKGKNIAIWRKGMLVRFQATMTGSETYLPNFTIEFIKGTKGHVSLKDGADIMPEIIDKINQDLEFKASQKGLELTEDSQ